MEEEPVNVIRESSRNLLKLSRQQQRDEVSDLSRSISEIRITPEKISEIAQNLKKKSKITALDLNVLKSGLLDDSKNTNIVLGTEGALRGLVRELTGQDANKQCAAAGCVCNLALADGRACHAIAKAAGAYLVVLLDNLAEDLVVPCAWALGNLAGSGPKVCELLVCQGAVGQLCELLQRTDVQDAAVYALVHFGYQLKDLLRVEHLKRMLQELKKVPLTKPSCQLLFILSCHKDFVDNYTEELSQRVLSDLPSAVENHSATCKSDVGNVICCKLIHLIRVLANVDVSRIYQPLLDIFISNNMTQSIYRILSVEGKSVLRDSMLWLLGNIYKFNSNNVLFNTLLCSKSDVEIL